MAKWKCEICGSEFENFHAQGFDNKIFCPLCYFKKENQQLKETYKEVFNNYQSLKEKSETLTSLNIYQSDKIQQLQKELEEYEQLKDNWNKLKKYIKTEIPEDVFIDTEWFVSILDKMQELEGSDRNE